MGNISLILGKYKTLFCSFFGWSTSRTYRTSYDVESWQNAWSSQFWYMVRPIQIQYIYCRASCTSFNFRLWSTSRFFFVLKETGRLEGRGEGMKGERGIWSWTFLTEILVMEFRRNEFDTRFICLLYYIQWFSSFFSTLSVQR